MSDRLPHDPDDSGIDAFGFYDDLFGTRDSLFDSTFDAVDPHGLDKPHPLDGDAGLATAGAGAREPRLRPTRGAHVALAAAMVVSGSVLAGLGLSTDDAPKKPAADATQAFARNALADSQQAAAEAASAAEVAAGLKYSVPKTLTVPSIGVDAPVTSTGQAADGTPLIPPFAHPEQVGWYTSTVSPGERGAAVLWGHLDTKKGTAVFQNLSALKPGDKVQVTRADDRVATFTVERTAVYPRESLPSDVLYDDPGYPALRLVTCGGRFDKKSQEYTSNVVVFARLTSVTTPRATVSHPAPIGTSPTPGATPAPKHAAPRPKASQVLPAAPKPSGPSAEAPKPAAPQPVAPKVDPVAQPPVPIPVPVPAPSPAAPQPGVPVPVAPKPEPSDPVTTPGVPDPTKPTPAKPTPPDPQQPAAPGPVPRHRRTEATHRDDAPQRPAGPRAARHRSTW